MLRDNVENDWGERDAARLAVAGQLQAERPQPVSAPAALRARLRAQLVAAHLRGAPRARHWAFDLAATAALVSLLVVGGVWLAGARTPSEAATVTVAPTVAVVVPPSLTPEPTMTVAPPPTTAPAGWPVINPENAAGVAALAELTAPGTEVEGIGLVRFAWSPDGAWLAVTHPGGVTLYRPDDLLPQRTFDLARPSAVAFSPDGRWLAASDSVASEIRMWDVATGAVVQTFSAGDELSSLTQLAFSPDGATLFGLHQRVTAWDVATGAVRFTFDTPAASLAVDPVRAQAAIGAWTQDIEIWDTTTGQRLQVLGRHASQAAAVAYSPDGALLASAGGDDGYIKLWDAATGVELRQLDGHTWGTLSLAFSPDGRVLASSGRDDRVRLWDAAGGALLQTINAEAGVIYPVAFSPRGDRLASGCMCSSHIRLWGVTETPLVLASPTPFVTPEGMAAAPTPEHDLVGDVDWLPNGAGLLVSAYPTGVDVYDPATLQVQHHLVDGGLWQMTVDPTGQRVVGLSQAGAVVTVRVWDAQTWQVLYTLADLPELFPQDAAFSPDGQTLALSGKEVVELRAAATGELRQSEPYTGWRVEVGFSADGTVLLAAGEWQVETRQWLTGNSGGGFEVRGALSYAFSPDGVWLLTRHRDEGLKLWDLAGDRPVLSRAASLTDVSVVAFSPDSRWVLDGPHFADGGSLVEIWEAATGTVVQRLQAPGEWRSAAFSPDGRWVALGNDQGQLQVWDVTTGALVNGVTRR